MWSIDILLPLILAGISAGFIAGLLGLGGGTVIVPIVLWLLHKLNIAGEYNQHLALGTSFAVMVFTTIISAWSQHKRGAVNWRIVQYLSPAIIVGSLLGAWLTQYISMWFLQLFFVVFLYAIAIQLLLKLKPRPSRQLPKPIGLFGTGGVIGILSSWAGVGGGALSVPFMTYCNVPIHVATGTSAALAWGLSVSGLIGYVFSGWHVNGLPEYTLGFIYTPVVFILAICTMTFAPFGVKVAHKLSADKLKIAMGLFLLLIASQMAWKLI
ncbi:MAG: sulfite exporter TauE/SafE family protein [Alysiella sp.]|uniref:sulfite exporter TauE/SafE family protein n=1 Tax=Alysiella sp. TaxID=1872483 RepID=UPI0026DBB75D|nr:sulfite exporter TauE/SafE family protein [Alysiella sp.]MDO4433684.1 sulfite exporter TauE/SafE family protein [Alysiella sp.]